MVRVAHSLVTDEDAIRILQQIGIDLIVLVHKSTVADMDNEKQLL